MAFVFGSGLVWLFIVVFVFGVGGVCCGLGCRVFWHVGFRFFFCCVLVVVYGGLFVVGFCIFAYVFFCVVFGCSVVVCGWL